MRARCNPWPASSVSNKALQPSGLPSKHSAKTCVTYSGLTFPEAVCPRAFGLGISWLEARALWVRASEKSELPMLRPIHVALVLSLCPVLTGCSSQQVPPSAGVESELKQLSEKIDLLAVRLPAPREPSSVDSTHPKRDSTSDFASLLKQLSGKIDLLAVRLPAPREPSSVDSTHLKRDGTSDLAWLLITNDPKEKAALVSRRVKQSGTYDRLSIENVQGAFADLEGLNVILNAPEGLDLAIVQQVEEARNRLVGLLRKDIPRIVGELDAGAVKAVNYSEARRLWAQSSSVLGSYPDSNDPFEAGRIQEMVSSHELVHTRFEVAQQQRYNLWACQQIRKAWQDFEANSDPGARMSTCLHFLGPIHPGLLDPLPLELYRDFLQTVHGKLSRNLYQELSEKLAVEKRQMLSDLQDPK